MRQSHRGLTGLSVAIIIAVVLLAVGAAAPASAGVPACGTLTVPIVNGGFEEPQLAPGANDFDPSITGWTVAGRVALFGPGGTFASGSQFVDIGDAGFLGSVSQTLDGTALAGRTVTFTIVAIGAGGIDLGSQSRGIGISDSSTEQTHTVVFDVPAGAPASLSLTLRSLDWDVDSISGTYEVPCTGPVVPAGCADAVASGEPVVYVADGGTGGTGRQVIIGTSWPDWIDGGSGNDLVCGGGGDDTISGGSGNDLIYGDEGSDVLDGESGGDFVDGGVDSDSCDGGTGRNDVVNCEG